MTMSQSNPLAIYQPAVSSKLTPNHTKPPRAKTTNIFTAGLESSNNAGTTPKKTLKDPERASKHRDFRKEERALELEAFRLVGVASEPSGTGPNGETRKWRQCKAVIHEIESLRGQVQAMAIQKQNLQSQINNLVSEKIALQEHVNSTWNLAVEQTGVIANLEAKNDLLEANSRHLEANNNILEAQIQALTGPTAPMDFSEMDFSETWQSMGDELGDGQR